MDSIAESTITLLVQELHRTDADLDGGTLAMSLIHLGIVACQIPYMDAKALKEAIESLKDDDCLRIVLEDLVDREAFRLRATMYIITTTARMALVTTG
ncbi:involucrin repeat protein, partial [Moniliophthora roreri]